MGKHPGIDLLVFWFGLKTTCFGDVKVANEKSPKMGLFK